MKPEHPQRVIPCLLAQMGSNFMYVLGAGDEEIFALIDEMKKLNPTAAIATTEKPIGKWRVIWNKQVRRICIFFLFATLPGL